MLRGQVRSAVRWLTDRAPGQTTSVVDSSGKTVFDVLNEKHPEPRCVNENAFIKCEELPPFMDVDITGGHIERVGRKLQGGAGPGCTKAMQWQDFLLRYGAPCERLRDEIDDLTRRLANNIVDWMDICALMAS